MKKIVFYTEKWTNGGIETFIVNAIENLDRENYKIEIITSQKENEIYDSRLLKLNVDLHEIHTKIFNPFIRIFKNIIQFKKTIKKIKPDIIHINVYNGVGLVYAYLSSKCGIKNIICHAHNTGIDNDYFKIKKFIHTICKEIFTSSKYTYLACTKDAAEFCFDMRKQNDVEIIRNGIDIKKFSFNETERKKIRSELNLSENDFLIGNVGRFVPQKNHKFLIKIFVKYLKINNNAKLILVGTGKLQRDIKEEAVRYGIEDKVLFLGMRRDIQRIFWAMDIFIFPSKYEGLGIVLIEAQASGLKCLASTNIPKDVKVTENIDFIDIGNENIEKWVEKIKENEKYSRTYKYEEIKEKGYDKSKIGESLNKIYLRIGESDG
mgnify:FL=1